MRGARLHRRHQPCLPRALPGPLGWAEVERGPERLERQEQCSTVFSLS